MKRYWTMWLESLLLRQPIFDRMTQERYAFGHGLTFVAGVGVLVGIVSVLRAALRFYFAPQVDAIKNTVLVHLQQMPWYTSLESSPRFQQQFQQGFDQFWRIFGSFILPDPFSPAVLAGILTTPVLLVLGWIVYGLLVHVFARAFRSQGHLGFGLGALSLGVAPQFLNLLTLIPGLDLGRGLVPLWTLLINYMAVRTAYRLSPGRAFWAAVLPLVVFEVAALLVAAVAAAVLLRGGAR